MNETYKTINSMVRGIVTRGVEDADSKHKNMIQVFIPAYHGKVIDASKVGTGEDPGIYPWCLVCGTIFKNNKSNANGWLSNLIQNQIQNTNNLNIVYPDVGDVIWLSFEGGDIRSPIFTGSIAIKRNQGSLNALGNASFNILNVSGGSLVSLISPIIIYNEVGPNATYNMVVGNDSDGACSMGKIMWHANNAKDLLVRIRQRNQSAFDAILNTYNSTKLIKDLDVKVSWSKYTLYDGSNMVNAIKSILDTPESHIVQDALIQEYIEVSLKNGRDKGLSDPATLMYYADLHNQSPVSADKMAKLCNNTLDSIHAETMKTTIGTRFSNRRNYTYNQIKLLKTQGKLTPLNNTSLNGNFSLVGEQVLYPVPGGGTRITSKFGPRKLTINGKTENDYHNGIDIAGSNVLGRPIIAAHSGTCVTNANTGSLGNNCVITSGLRKTLYGHMVRTQFAVGSSTAVNAGDVIGYVGTTGKSSGPHLHFALKINNIYVDPTPYLMTSS